MMGWVVERKQLWEFNLPLAAASALRNAHAPP